MMITCTETGKVLSSGQKVYAATRLGDPYAFALSEEILKKIPKRCRTTMLHRYKTGGINIHMAVITGENGTSELVVNRDDGFIFSVPSYEFRPRMPKTSQEFRFPG